MSVEVMNVNGAKITKITRKSGRTRLAAGLVYRWYNTEQEAEADLETFIRIARDINAAEGWA